MCVKVLSHTWYLNLQDTVGEPNERQRVACEMILTSSTMYISCPLYIPVMKQSDPLEV